VGLRVSAPSEAVTGKLEPQAQPRAASPSEEDLRLAVGPSRTPLLIALAGGVWWLVSQR
jgi:hypothetical protein